MAKRQRDYELGPRRAIKGQPAFFDAGRDRGDIDGLSFLITGDLGGVCVDTKLAGDVPECCVANESKAWLPAPLVLASIVERSIRLI